MSESKNPKDVCVCENCGKVIVLRATSYKKNPTYEWSHPDKKGGFQTLCFPSKFGTTVAQPKVPPVGSANNETTQFINCTHKKIQAKAEKVNEDEQ